MKLKKTFTLISTLAVLISMAGILPVLAAPRAASTALGHADAGAAQTYVVLYKKNALPSDTAKVISSAGGSIIYRYPAIGVVIASSDNPGFAAALLEDTRIQGAAASAGFATQLDVDNSDWADAPVDPGLPATDSDSLSGLQWDMVQIHTPEAHAVTGGSPSIVVGDIDTGLDYTHPDLAPNVSDANSVNCVSGAPVAGMVAAMDDNGHGTHTAGTIAAASNGIGIVGVAPNVKIAGIKAGNADGYFFPEAVVCAFMWAGSHPAIKVTNNSYFADPWLFNCRNDAAQRAIWQAERRAIQYAISKGVVVVAAEGNQADDLAHPTQDATSPDDTNPVLRQIHNDCAVVPVEVPGVVGVTANGNLQLKSFYSSYGVGTADVVAPGGDSLLQRTAASPNGRVLSTWPASLLTVTCAPSRRVVDASGATYCYQQGTSMASPHAAGVAALIMSTGVTSPGAVAAQMQNTADKIACPADMSIYAPFPAVDNGAPQVCQGDLDYNSFNGHGQINALHAVAP
ncbi:MAG: S8 family serine peptidase [Bacteroidota bacterium]